MAVSVHTCRSTQRSMHVRTHIDRYIQITHAYRWCRSCILERVHTYTSTHIKYIHNFIPPYVQSYSRYNLYIRICNHPWAKRVWVSVPKKRPWELLSSNDPHGYFFAPSYARGVHNTVGLLGCFSILDVFQAYCVHIQTKQHTILWHSGTLTSFRPGFVSFPHRRTTPAKASPWQHFSWKVHTLTLLASFSHCSRYAMSWMIES